MGYFDGKRLAAHGKDQEVDEEGLCLPEVVGSDEVHQVVVKTHLLTIVCVDFIVVLGVNLSIILGEDWEDVIFKVGFVDLNTREIRVK